MSKFIEFIKTHPYGTALGAAAIVGIYVLYSNSGSSGGSVDVSGGSYDAALVQAGSQLQQQQLAYNAAALQSNNQAQVANNQITAEEVIANLKSVDTLAGISATRDIQLNQDTLSAQTTQAVSILQAQVAESQITAGIQQTQINAKAYVDIASLPYTSVTPALINEVHQNTSDISGLATTSNTNEQNLVDWQNQYFTTHTPATTIQPNLFTPTISRLSAAQSTPLRASYG